MAMDFDIRLAIEVFARGFSFTRSFIHPYVTENIVRDIWALRDSFRKNGKYRSDEFVAYGIDAERMHQTHTHGRYRICVIRRHDESDAPIRQQFKEINYRLMTTEPLMVHLLQRIPVIKSCANIELVSDAETAEKLKVAAGSRQIPEKYLFGNPVLMRQYSFSQPRRSKIIPNCWLSKFGRIIDVCVEIAMK